MAAAVIGSWFHHWIYQDFYVPVWPNVGAAPVCAGLGVLAAFIFRDHIGRALKDWWARHLGHKDDLDAIHARLDAHADLLDTSTPGGLAAILAELRDVRAAVEAQAGSVEALASIVRPVPKTGGKTPMRRTAGGKDGSDGKTG